jgi:DNA-binding beta-propeller fold protein YncE
LESVASDFCCGNDRAIKFTASDPVWASLKDLGRTEDVKFSPDNRRLAIVGYKKNKLVVFDVDIAVSSGITTVSLTDVVEVTSASLSAPHGLTFIDDETLIVVNRWGEAPIFRLPPSGGAEKKIDVSALLTIHHDDAHQLDSPGSVSVSRVADNLFEILICNNYAHYVTRHLLQKNDQFELISNEKLLGRGLNIPDGVAESMDKRWIAISNHGTHCVYLYENTPRLNLRSRPDGVLRNINYPHGVLFMPDGNNIIVADAGSPFINIYAKNGDGWKGARNPQATFRVMDEAVYLRGRINPQEGGPKGIDIDGDMKVLVTTCDEQVLGFFALHEVLKQRGIPMDRRRKSLQWRYERIRAELRRLRGWK